MSKYAELEDFLVATLTQFKSEDNTDLAENPKKAAYQLSHAIESLFDLSTLPIFEGRHSIVSIRGSILTARRVIHGAGLRVDLEASLAYVGMITAMEDMLKAIRKEPFDIFAETTIKPEELKAACADVNVEDAYPRGDFDGDVLVGHWEEVKGKVKKGPRKGFVRLHSILKRIYPGSF